MISLSVLFPSWKFFDELGLAPRLHYRVAGPGQEFGPWIDALEARRRNWTSLFLNPDGNLRFATVTLLERLIAEANASEADRPEDLDRSVNYRLVGNLVREQVMERHSGREGLRFQFKVSAMVPGSDSMGTHEVLLSSEFEA